MKPLLCLAVAALAASTSAAAADPGPKLDMLDFFTGKTHADNVMRTALHRPHRLVVDSVGGHNKEGEFVLIDNVQEEGKPGRKRVWAMRPAGAMVWSSDITIGCPLPRASPRVKDSETSGPTLATKGNSA